jgi:N-acetyl-alpha-D-muramate 1-phosphate uridylyltransferase
MDIQVAILAGGLATRLGELTKSRPKSLVEILSKPFLGYQLELLKDKGVTDVVLCIGHFGAQIKETFGDGAKYGMRITYSIEDKLLGTAGALKNAETMLKDVFFVMYGDSYLSLDFQKIQKYFLKENKLALDTVYRNYDYYDKSNMIIAGNMVKKYSKTEKTKDMVYIDYGATVFKKEALKLIPENRSYSLEDLFIRLIEMEQLMAYEVKDRFYEIGSPQGLRDFEEYIKTGGNKRCYTTTLEIQGGKG